MDTNSKPRKKRMTVAEAYEMGLEDGKNSVGWKWHNLGTHDQYGDIMVAGGDNIPWPEVWAIVGEHIGQTIARVRNLDEALRNYAEKD